MELMLPEPEAEKSPVLLKERLLLFSERFPEESVNVPFIVSPDERDTEPDERLTVRLFSPEPVSSMPAVADEPE